MPVAIQHEVTHYQHTGSSKIRKFKFHGYEIRNLILILQNIQGTAIGTTRLARVFDGEINPGV